MADPLSVPMIGDYGALMGWMFALWGLGGGLAVEVLDFIKAVRRVGHGWPWRYPYGPGGGPYLVSVMGRAAASALLAGAAGTSVNGMTPLLALALGAAAPLILEKLSQQIPLNVGMPTGEPPAPGRAVAQTSPSPAASLPAADSGPAEPRPPSASEQASMSEPTTTQRGGERGDGR